ncbi:MAG: monovalent cation/H+ antiporter subunit D family protein [Candidatus Omnitrophica bacterium]|nr:monovalent cation/H+ antiporter subunit D family protein [Candidatus Omnitrophota bacterium]
MHILPLFVAIPLGGAFFISIVSRKFKWIPDILSNLITFTLLIMAFSTLGKGPFIYKMGGWPPPIGINLVLDGLSILMLVIICTISFIATLFSIRYMEQYTSKSGYYTLFLLMVAGMNAVVLSGDMFNLYVFMEMAAIASYALVAFGTEHEELEASFKYAVMGIVASSFILLGIVLLYSFTSTLNMADMAQVLTAKSSSSLVLFVSALFLMGFGLKAAQVPFHAWLPDAHPSAPAPISAMLSGVLIKTLGIYALIRIFYNVFGITPVISQTFLAMGAISMVIGVLLALGQWDFKRLLAYHSISQMGYVMLGIGLGTPLGILGGLFHLVNHAAFKSLLFFNSGAIEYATDTRQLEEMGGLKERMPVTSTTCSIASFSIAGIPPFNGFWSKLIIIIACIQAGKIFYGLVAVIVSILTLASFLKVQRYAIFGELSLRLKTIKEVPVSMCISMVVLAVFCIGLGALIVPGIREVVLSPAVEVLQNGVEYTKIVLGN